AVACPGGVSWGSCDPRRGRSHLRGTGAGPLVPQASRSERGHVFRISTFRTLLHVDEEYADPAFGSFCRRKGKNRQHLGHAAANGNFALCGGSREVCTQNAG